jgi:hypothetical protein
MCEPPTAILPQISPWGDGSRLKAGTTVCLLMQSGFLFKAVSTWTTMSPQLLPVIASAAKQSGA